MISKNVKDNLQEKALSWFWVVLFISAILFFRSLLVDMHVETTRLAEERERFESQLEDEREKSRELYQEFYAEINRSVENAIKVIGGGGVPLRPELPSGWSW